MYIIELFLKLKENIKKGKFQKPSENINDENEDNIENCSHTFFPIDSTGKILACSKCGMIYKLKKNEKNPFQ